MNSDASYRRKYIVVWSLLWRLETHIVQLNVYTSNLVFFTLSRDGHLFRNEWWWNVTLLVHSSSRKPSQASWTLSKLLAPGMSNHFSSSSSPRPLTNPYLHPPPRVSLELSHSTLKRILAPCSKRKVWSAREHVRLKLKLSCHILTLPSTPCCSYFIMHHAENLMLKLLGSRMPRGLGKASAYGPSREANRKEANGSLELRILVSNPRGRFLERNLDDELGNCQLSLWEMRVILQKTVNCRWEKAQHLSGKWSIILGRKLPIVLEDAAKDEPGNW